MTTTSIRKKLHDYIADTTDSKVKGMYLLLKEDIDKKAAFQLTPKHVEILEEEKSNHQQGLSKSYSIAEAREFIKKGKKA